MGVNSYTNNIYERFFVLKQYFCEILGLYKFKQLAGENVNDYHLNAQTNRNCEYCLICMRCNFNKRMVALKGKNVNYMHIDMPLNVF